MRNKYVKYNRKNKKIIPLVILGSFLASDPLNISMAETKLSYRGYSLDKEIIKSLEENLEIYQIASIEKKVYNPKPSPTPHFDYTEKDINNLAKLIFGEARGTNDLNRISTAYTAINRTKDKRWPSNLEEVINQPLQYSCFNKDDPNFKLLKIDPKYYSDEDQHEWKRALEISRGILSGEIKDPTNGATSYRDSSSKYYNDFKKEYARSVKEFSTGRTSHQGATRIAYAKE